MVLRNNSQGEQKMNKTQRMVFFAMLISLGTALHALEMVLPNPFPLPGAKIGLANIITLLVILLFGFKEGMLVSLMRVFLGSFISGTLFSPAFLLSLTGAVFSTIVMSIMQKYSKIFSVIGISIAGALTHNIGQLTIAYFLVETSGVLYYLPFLLIFSLPTGFFTGLVTKVLLKHIKLI